MMRKKRRITGVSALLLACVLFCGCADKETSGAGAAAERQSEAAEAEEFPAEAEGTAAEDGAVSETERSGAGAEGAAAEDDAAAISSAAVTEAALPDGVYTADFDTDSSMFRVNEACDGKGELTVKDGKMVIHISLGSKKIVNLYPGLAEDAQKEGASLLEPTVDTVTYSDGLTEEVYGFDVPVPVLEQEFDLALIGTKGTWYDHKVSVSNPEPLEESTGRPENGTYTVELTLDGGSGKATIQSPAQIAVTDEGITVTLEWSSPNYDYMIVDGEKYLPVNTEGNSVFEVPVAAFDEPLVVIGDTVAMSRPHEVEYTVTFHSGTLKAE